MINPCPGARMLQGRSTNGEHGPKVERAELQAAPLAPVLSPAAGEVAYVQLSPTRDWPRAPTMVIVDRDGCRHFLSRLGGLLAFPGDEVEEGQPVACAGQNGRLQWECRWPGRGAGDGPTVGAVIRDASAALREELPKWFKLYREHMGE